MMQSLAPAATAHVHLISRFPVSVHLFALIEGGLVGEIASGADLRLYNRKERQVEPLGCRTRPWVASTMTVA